MFGADPSEPVLQGQAGAVSGERGAGRPAGSGNKFNQDLVKMVARHFGGRHALDVLAEVCANALVADPQKKNLEAIQLMFGCPTREKAGLILERILGKVIDATTPRLQHVKADVRVSAPVIFDMSGTADESSFGDDGDLLDLDVSDYNDLAGGNG
jgi:hypothetical protein